MIGSLLNTKIYEYYFSEKTDHVSRVFILSNYYVMNYCTITHTIAIKKTEFRYGISTSSKPIAKLSWSWLGCHSQA